MSATAACGSSSHDPRPDLEARLSGTARLSSFLHRVRARIPRAQARAFQLMSVHVLVFGASYLLSYVIRFDGAVPDHYHEVGLRTLPLVLAVQLGCCLLMGVHRGMWRYASFVDMMQLVEAVTLGAGLLFVANHALLHPQIPRSVLLIDAILAILATGTLRGASRLMRERYYPLLAGGASERVLVFSASPAGEALVREIQRHPGLGIRVAGIVDPNPELQGCSLGGIRVLGAPSELESFVARHRVDSVLIPAPSASSTSVRSLLDELGGAKVRLQAVPGLDALLTGSLTVHPREVNPDDLLRREPVDLDGASIGQVLGGRTVLVTGAAGSIGSEICRQVLGYRPRKLVLLDISENGLYWAEKELRGRSGETEVVTCLTSVADQPQLRACLALHSPEVVFHAAAHKHVPMMEACPGEAIKNNVFGTRTLVDESIAAGVGTFVMISTDKAVNPTSVMGASKRLAEMYLQSLGRRAKTRLVTVRFGNVLGSNGSVVPLFQEQIRRGGPITVTHPEMTRYFMTIPEAAQLVIQAGAFGESGEILVLDMGEPVRIVDVARDLIRLSGLQPGEDIDIEFVGLRPGEKLHEQLYDQAETPLPTRHPKIRVARHRRWKREEILGLFDELARVVNGRPEDIVAALESLLPEYRPARRACVDAILPASLPLPNGEPMLSPSA